MSDSEVPSRCTNQSRTSISVSPGRPSPSVPLARNEGPQFRPGPLRSEYIPAVHATDATDTVLLGCRFYGCLEPQLYNQTRMHSTLNYVSPMQFEQDWEGATTEIAA
jgi:hypothetical protein